MPQIDRSRASITKLLSPDGGGGDHYYGGSSAAVPFKWESQPGTPRRPSSSGFELSNLAPLTPPPSYFSTKPVNPKKTNTHLGYLRPKNRSAPSSPSTSSSSSSSSTFSPMRTPDLYGRSSGIRSTWFGSASKHYNATKSSSGCYGSFLKVLLRDIK